MKFIHTADLHLGQMMYQYYSRTDEHDHFFGQLRAWCAAYNPDALLVSGDVFDIQNPPAAVRQHFNNVFADLRREFPEMAIVVTAGNHDSASRIEADRAVWDLAGVTLVGRGPTADGDDLDRFIVQLPAGFIVAVPFMLGSHTESVQRLLDRVEELNPDGLPVVMMAHAAMDGCDFAGHGDIGNQRVLEAADFGAGYDYLALGHIHRPQTLGQPLDDDLACAESRYLAPVMRYSGSALHVSCDEAYPHSVSLVDIDCHCGEVRVERLRIDELRHFYILPPEGQLAAATADEAMAAIDTFCADHNRGYIRLRVDVRAPLPPDFITRVYERLESTGGEVRLNPRTIYEGEVQHTEGDVPRFELAELQQMVNPLDFIRETIDQYPDLDLGALAADFKEIDDYLQTKDR